MIDLTIRRIRLAAKSVLGRKLDGLEELQMDHLLVELLFTRMKATKDKKRRETLYKRIKTKLEDHMSSEESVLYPRFEDDKNFKVIVLEAFEEHRQMKTILRELGELSPATAKFEARLNLLIENVRHHVREEENTLFPKIRRKLDAAELHDLAKELRTAKRESAAAA